ncbi:unnamed protein product [Rotaria sp. Silwood1]|nr:unnamed protein product [Rotaria sp. Silwood1]
MYQTGATSSISVVVDDFNKDHRLDIVVVNNDTGAINILFGRYEGFQNQTRYSVGSNPQSVAIGDVNNDTRLDIVVANLGSNDVSILLGYGNGSFENQTRYSVGSSPQSVAIGDVNNDARLDIVVANLENDNERACTFDDVQQMNYLECVIKETLRLLPSVPIIGREIQETFQYGHFS